MTQFDRIKQFGKAEMLAFITDVIKCGDKCCSECPLQGAELCNASGILDWLNSEVTEE